MARQMLWLQVFYLLLILEYIRADPAKKVLPKRGETVKKDPTKIEPGKKEEPVEQTNYCNFKCGAEHIACNNNGTVGPHCPPNVAVINFDDSIINVILSLHNDKRDNVSAGNFNNLPSAVRMGVMQWDKELAHLAKIKALRCSSSLDHCHSTMKFENPGQSLAILAYRNETAKFTLKALVENRTNNWFSGSSLLKSEQIHKFKDNRSPPLMLPFALAIMDKNNHIGCGAVQFELNSNHYFHLVCNYAYKLRTGDLVYKVGKATSECTTGKDKKYKDLCSNKELYT